MATQLQEDLFNKIVKYFNYLDTLVDLVENVEHDFSEEQFEIIETTVDKLEKYTDNLSAAYVYFVQKGESLENTNEIKSLIQNILITIEECRNKINMLYSK